MNKRTPVVDMAGDWQEAVVQQARHLGTDEIRRKVFLTISGRGRKPRSQKQIMEAAGIDAAKSQQVTNALGHLSKHHLIRRVENDGSVPDGSRYLYEKEPSVHANRHAIIKRADNKDLADRTPTKRRTVQTTRVVRIAKNRSELKKRKLLTVLYLTSSPRPEGHLRVDAEIRHVQQEIRGSIFRESVRLEPRPAADLTTIMDGLNDLRPQIVHFSGHSSDTAIAGDNGDVENPGYSDINYQLLAQALSATDDPPQVVVLNSCESAAAQSALSPIVPVLIAMRAEVSDVAAAAFASRFYASIASGQSVKSAFAQGVLAVTSASITEQGTPELIVQPSINPSKIILT